MERIAINLLPRKQHWYLRRRQLGRMFQLVSFGLAGTYVVMLVGLFGWRLVVSGQTRTVERRIDQAKEEIGALAEVESQELLVKSKMSRLAQVRSGQVDFSQMLNQLVELFPEGIDLGQVEVKSAQEIEVTGRTFDPIALAEVLNRVQDRARVSSWLNQVRLENVTKSSSGEYGLTLILVPKK